MVFFKPYPVIMHLRYHNHILLYASLSESARVYTTRVSIKSLGTGKESQCHHDLLLAALICPRPELDFL